MTDTTPVRVATPDDHAEILRVVNLAYRVEDFFVCGDRLTAPLISRYAWRAGGCFLVLDGDVPGALSASVYFEAREGHGWFAMLAVDPGAQGRGLARVLIEALEARCRSLELPRLELEVVDLRTELPAFYQRFGFAATGRRPFSDAEKLKRPAEMIVMGKRVGGSEPQPAVSAAGR